MKRKYLFIGAISFVQLAAGDRFVKIVTLSDLMIIHTEH